MPATRRVALVTYAELPLLSDDDRLIIDALAHHGLEAVPAVWSDTSVEWAALSAAVVRSTWDYYHDLPMFLRWIDRMEATGVPLFNPPDILRWNSDKRYLRRLETSGVAVVPTRWVETGETASLSGILAERSWDQAVVKPAVSASAWETWKTSLTSAGTDEERFRRLVARGTVMVQPYIPEVALDGEWSFLYVDGTFSHAVLKRTEAGEFRVQAHHGGTARFEQPADDIQRQAESVLRAALTDPARVLYARVDGCISNGRFLLMELELLEPSLFLGLAPGAPERLAAAIAARVR